MKINLEGKCNNKCRFCLHGNRVNHSTEYLKKLANFNSACDDRVVIGGCEPTVQPDFFNLLHNVGSVNPSIVQLRTNARKLKNKTFLKKVIAAGVTHFKISLHGHCAKIHEHETRVKGSFRETIAGIRNTVSLAGTDAIVLSVVITKDNYGFLTNIIRVAKKYGIQKVQLNVVETSDPTVMVPLTDFAERFYQRRYRFFFDVIMKVKGMPYCLFPEPESAFLHKQNREEYVQPQECKDCIYVQKCSGIQKEYLRYQPDVVLKAREDKPAEVMIEVESGCNYICKFCFNRVSFASGGFGKEHLQIRQVKTIIDAIARARVQRVRFTGGEPMLRQDFFEILEYARSKNLEVRINTNGSFITSESIAKKIVQYADYVLFAMHACNKKDETIITGAEESFTRKIQAMKWLKKAGLKILRVNTIATKKNIKQLRSFYALFRAIGVDRWAINRLIPVPGEEAMWTEEEAHLLVKELTVIKKDAIKRKLEMWIHVVNGIPLCVGDPVIMHAISSGARAVDGHERFAIDPRGFAKPIYYMDQDIGDTTDIMACWNHPFMRLLRNYEMLPPECKSCFILDKCKGGNRYCAYVSSGSYEGDDPLMNYTNIDGRYIF